MAMPIVPKMAVSSSVRWLKWLGTRRAACTVMRTSSSEATPAMIVPARFTRRRHRSAGSCPMIHASAGAVVPTDSATSPASATPAGLKEAGDEAYRVLRDLIVEGNDSRRLRAEEPDHLALAAWSVVHGLGMLIIEGQVPAGRADPAQRRALTDVTVRLLETGLRR